MLRNSELVLLFYTWLFNITNVWWLFLVLLETIDSFGINYALIYFEYFEFQYSILFHCSVCMLFYFIIIFILTCVYALNFYFITGFKFKYLFPESQLMQKMWY